MALYCAEKLVDMGAIVLTLSDSGGMIHCPQGFSAELVQLIKSAKSADPSVRVKSFSNVSLDLFSACRCNQLEKAAHSFGEFR